MSTIINTVRERYLDWLFGIALALAILASIALSLGVIVGVVLLIKEMV